jgi:hypothetical protein
MAECMLLQHVRLKIYELVAAWAFEKVTLHSS